MPRNQKIRTVKPTSSFQLGSAQGIEPYIYAPYIPIYSTLQVIPNQFVAKMGIMQNIDKHTLEIITKLGKVLLRTNRTSGSVAPEKKLLMVWVDLKILHVPTPERPTKITRQHRNRKKTRRLLLTAIATQDMCLPDKRPAIYVVSTDQTPAAIYLPITDVLLTLTHNHVGLGPDDVYRDFKQAIKDHIEYAIFAEDALQYGLSADRDFSTSSKVKSAINKEKKTTNHL
jgi:hypothetical protein